MNLLRKNRRTAGSAALAVVTLLVAPMLAACGGSTDAEPKPTITDTSQLVQGAAVKYEEQADFQPQDVQAIKGQMVFISVLSDVTGRLELEGAEAVRQPVKAGELSTVVMDAADEGTFDLTLLNKGERTRLATIEVKP